MVGVVLIGIDEKILLKIIIQLKKILWRIKKIANNSEYHCTFYTNINNN